jgi:hypothetical protein
MLRILLTAALAVASVNAQTKVCSKKPSSSVYAPAPGVASSPAYFGAYPHSSSPISSAPAHVGGSPHSSSPSLGNLAPSSSSPVSSTPAHVGGSPHSSGPSLGGLAPSLPVSSSPAKVSGSPHSSGPSLGGFAPSSVGSKPSSSSPNLSASPSSSGCVNSPSNRQCWGQYDINTDYYTTTPQGKIVEVMHLNFLISSISLPSTMSPWHPTVLRRKCMCTMVNSLVPSLRPTGVTPWLFMFKTTCNITGMSVAFN